MLVQLLIAGRDRRPWIPERVPHRGPGATAVANCAKLNRHPAALAKGPGLIGGQGCGQAAVGVVPRKRYLAARAAERACSDSGRQPVTISAPSGA